MTKEEFANLQPGDIVRAQASGLSYVVIENFGNRVTAIRTADLTNPVEWDLVTKAQARSPNETKSEP